MIQHALTSPFNSDVTEQYI